MSEAMKSTHRSPSSGSSSIVSKHTSAISPMWPIRRVGQCVRATGPSGGATAVIRVGCAARIRLATVAGRISGYCGPPKPVTTIPSIGSAGYVNRNRDERRADPRCSQEPPQRRAGARRGAVQASRHAVGVRREAEDAVRGGVHPGEQRGPGGRRERRDRGTKSSERPRAREGGEGRELAFADQPSDELVVASVETETEHPPHRRPPRARRGGGRPRPAGPPLALSSSSSTARRTCSSSCSTRPGSSPPSDPACLRSR